MKQMTCRNRIKIMPPNPCQGNGYPSVLLSRRWSHLWRPLSWMVLSGHLCLLCVDLRRHHGGAESFQCAGPGTRDKESDGPAECQES